MSQVWTQQAKIVANDSIGSSYQVALVSLNSDGTILAVGGYGDNNGIGQHGCSRVSQERGHKKQRLLGITQLVTHIQAYQLMPGYFLSMQ